MRKVIFTLLLLIAIQALIAVPVTLTQATNIASTWLSESYKRIYTVSSTDTINDAQNETMLYIVNLSPRGFVIVAADDRSIPILGYSYKGSISNTEDESFRSLMDNYAEAIHVARVNNVPNTSTLPLWNAITVGMNRHVTIDSVFIDMDTLWCGSNRYTPYYSGTSHSNGGCVAVAMARVMDYAKQARAELTANDTLRTSYNNTQYLIDRDSLIVHCASFSRTNYYLKLIDTYYQNSQPLPDTLKEALIYACGIVVKANYGHSTGANVYPEQMARFNYYSEYAEMRIYTDNAWQQLINESITNNRPILYAGRRQNTGGHQMVLHGYVRYEDEDGNDTYMNYLGFGNHGEHDAYYALSNICYDGNIENAFNYYHSMVYDIHQRPYIKQTIQLAGTTTFTGTAQMDIVDLQGNNIFSATTSTGEFYLPVSVEGTYNIRITHSNSNYSGYYQANKVLVDGYNTLSTGVITLNTDTYSTINVPAQYATIQEALSHLQDGGTINITENIGNYAQVTAILWGPRHTHLVGINTPLLRNVRIVMSGTGVNSSDLIEGLRFDGNKVSMAIPRGGAICLLAGASPTIRNCVFYDNTIDIGTLPSFNQEVENDNRVICRVGVGGAIFVEGVDNSTMKPMITGCNFLHNKIIQGTAGSAIALYGNAVITDCTFTDCGAEQTAAYSISAAIFIATYSYGGETIINNNTFTDNIALNPDFDNEKNCLDIKLYTTYYTIDRLVISNNTFSHNVAGQNHYCLQIYQDNIGKGFHTPIEIIGNSVVSNSTDSNNWASGFLINVKYNHYPLVVNNNLLLNTKNNGITINNYTSYGSTEFIPIKICNNTFNNCYCNSLYIKGIGQIYIKNNIFNTQTPISRQYIVWDATYAPTNVTAFDLTLTIKNNLYRPYVLSPDHSFVYIPNSSPISYTLYSSGNITGDPGLETDYTPLWTSTAKSICIDNGDPDTDGDGISWVTDTDDRDGDVTRLDIGAKKVPLYHYNYITTLQAGTAGGKNVYNWICFPYMDKLYNSGSPETNEYIFHTYHGNNLLVTQPSVLNTIQWNYNTNSGTVYFENGWNNTTNPVYSQYGYKVCLLNGQSARPLESAGFHCGTTGNSNETINIDAKETGHAYREIWVGYFKEANVDALTALGSVANQLIEIKTKDWAYSRSSVLQTWSMPSGSHRFHKGEAVSLRYVGTSAINFTWTVPDTINNSPAYQEAAVQHFNYAEQADYTPFFVKVDSDKSITKNAQAELALYINGQCYGAEVVQGDTVQINGYINEIPDLEQATVEFRYWAGGEKAIEQKVDSYSVYNQEYQVYEKRPLEMDARKSFYVVSFDAKDNGSVPAVTTLETNYPNPFNPETTIKYSVAKAGKVNLSIYNIKGQLVRTLVNENQEPSYRSIVWKGENNNGSKVSSGVYFYRLQTAEKVMTKKMLLMK